MFEELFENGRPEWSPLASSGDPTIKREDYTDENFIRKAMYEKSTGEKYRMYVWSWTGKRLVNPIAIVGNKNCFTELCIAIRKYAPSSKAVFVSTKDRLLLIGLDGNCLKNPVSFRAETFNDNPANDWELIRNLPDYIEIIRQKIGSASKSDPRKSMRSFKTWINVLTGDVVGVPVHAKFDVAIRNNPEKFGVDNQKTLLHARVAAERKGWVAFGVNAEDPENVRAVVQSMSDAHAKKAAKAMFDVKKGDWHTLSVLTNTSKASYNGDDIAEYCGVHMVESFTFDSRALAVILESLA